jgi:hypothetical protein
VTIAEAKDCGTKVGVLIYWRPEGMDGCRLNDPLAFR